MNEIRRILLTRYDNILEAAEALGVTRQALYKWMSDGVPLMHCARVARKLKVHPAKLNYAKAKELVPELEDYDNLSDPR